MMNTQLPLAPMASGYVMNPNRELLCVAAPVFDHRRRPCASLTVAMVASQIEAPSRIDEVGAAVRRAAHGLSHALGGRPSEAGVLS